MSANDSAGLPDLLDRRPTLRAWLDEYAAIEREYLDALSARGIDFGPRGRFDARVREAKRRLRDKGTLFRNGDASISAGPLSPACLACSDDLGSKTFVLSLQCNRDCYFCFNANQEGDEECARVGDWRQELDEFASACGDVTHVGLTGGEPLLHRREAVEFVRYARERNPKAHVRLYTAGDFLVEDILIELRDAGLDELRMSVKLDVLDVPDAADGIVEDAARALALAKSYIPSVMVEMPVIPGTGDAMRRLLVRLDELGVFGINLLEFGFPLSDWSEFARRGFEAKNPPFPVTYDYSYPGGLPVDGSELLCLELLEFALDEGLALGVHYCSLENKNRGQVFRQNAAVQLNPELYELDGSDFFYKTAKVFDGDAPAVRARLESMGAPFEVDDRDESLSFHPDRLEDIGDLSVLPALSYNVVERNGEGCAVRELALELAERSPMMEEKSLWQARATMWELLAFSLRYPDAELAEAVASGEWADAAAEVANVLKGDSPQLGHFAPCHPERSAAGAESKDPLRRGGADDRAPDALLHALRAEATRLFVGAPDAACSPYEGVWRAADDGVQALLFVNPHSMEVERFMRACGLGRPEGTNEPLDHAATECELLQHLAMLEAGLAEPPGGPAADAFPGGSPAAAYASFLDDHARAWMPRFAERLAAESREPFYRAAAQLLGAMVVA